MRTISIAALGMLAAASAQANCDPPNSFRLYRTSTVGPIYVATFDRPGERPSFNEENCHMVAEMLASKVGVTSAWWCEPADPD
jgi:hypothetical protein